MRNKFLMVLVAVMAVTSAFPCCALYAAEITEAVGTTATEDGTQTKEYIILLPIKDGVSYGYDENHASDQYSSVNYSVLLYKEGEQVEISVDGASGYYVKDALESGDVRYAEDAGNGKLSFTMPAADLSLIVPSSGIGVTEVAAGTDGAVQATGNIMVSRTRLNVRSGASTDSTIIGLLTPGTRVSVLGEDNGWYSVRFVKDGSTVDGYVNSKYLLGLESLYTAVSSTEAKASASDDAASVGTLAEGEEIVVLEGDNAGWTKIAYATTNSVTDAYVKTECITAETDPAVDPLLG